MPTPTSCAGGALRSGEKWHLDEVFVGINARLRCLLRAVDQRGNVLDVLVQSRRSPLVIGQ